MMFDSLHYFFLLTCELWNQNTGHVLVRTWKAMLPELSLYPLAHKCAGYEFKACEHGRHGPREGIVEKLWNKYDHSQEVTQIGMHR